MICGHSEHIKIYSKIILTYECMRAVMIEEKNRSTNPCKIRVQDGFCFLSTGNLFKIHLKTFLKSSFWLNFDYSHTIISCYSENFWNIFEKGILLSLCRIVFTNLQTTLSLNLDESW